MFALSYDSGLISSCNMALMAGATVFSVNTYCVAAVVGLISAEGALDSFTFGASIALSGATWAFIRGVMSDIGIYGACP